MDPLRHRQGERANLSCRGLRRKSEGRSEEPTAFARRGVKRNFPETDDLNGNRFHETYPVTAFLLLFNTVFFILELIQNLKVTGQIPGAFDIVGFQHSVTDMLGELNWAGIRRGEHWRLVASAFLHGGFLHILMNGMVLADLGRLSEPLLSSWKFLVAYGLSTLGGAAGSLIGQRIAHMPAAVGSVGASGALCGLIGLLLVYSIKERQPEMRDGLIRWIIWMVILTFSLGGVDHAGHLGGFVAGGAFGLTVKDYTDSRTAPRWRYPGYIVALAGVAGLALALWNYFEKR